MQDVVDKNGLHLDKFVSLNDMIQFVDGAHNALTEATKDYNRQHAPDKRVGVQAKIFQDGINTMYEAIMKGLLSARQKEVD